MFFDGALYLHFGKSCGFGLTYMELDVKISKNTSNDVKFDNLHLFVILPVDGGVLSNKFGI